MVPASDLRIIPRLEKWPWLVQFVQTNGGKLLLAAIFGIIWKWMANPGWWEVSAALAGMSIWPQHRRPLVALTTFYWLVAFVLKPSSEDYVAAIAVFALAWFVLVGFERQPEHWAFRRPVRNLLLLYGGIIMLAALPLTPFATAVLWSFILIFGKYLWFMAYALTERRKKIPQPLPVRLFHFQPFWGSSNVPYPKGESYLSRIEAKTDQDLAVTQLKGLKLLLWAGVLICVSALFNEFVRGTGGVFDKWVPWHLAVPELPPVITAYLSGSPMPRDISWLSVLANFIGFILHVSIGGHCIIAACRMAGFNALRNTYKPMASVTIAEFYNRIYYYFKELLVDFFFYPAYLRYFKERPRMRLFFATLAAAGFGNLLYHFLAGIGIARSIGLWRTLAGFHVYAVYAIFMGVAIAISQMLNAGKPPKRSLARVVGVLFFYALIMVLDSGVFGLSIFDYGSFIINLFIPFPR